MKDDIVEGAAAIERDEVWQACDFTVTNECGYGFKHLGTFAADGSNVMDGAGVPDSIGHGAGGTHPSMSWSVHGLHLDGAICGSVFRNWGGKAPYVMFAACIRAAGDSPLIAAYVGEEDIYNSNRFTGSDLVNWISIPGSRPPGVSAWNCVGPKMQTVEVTRNNRPQITLHGDLSRTTDHKNFYHAEFTISSL